ncbi:MAG: phosphoserine phosphatase SerB [Nesterenkonia sp.]
MTDASAAAVAMIAADQLDGALIRSLTAEFDRRGVVHHAEAATFSSDSGPVRAVRWWLSLADSDDGYGTQLINSLLEDAAEQLDGVDDTTTTVLPRQLPEGRRRMLIMDVDSTLIDQEVIDLLADHAGRAEEVAAVTERAMRGELDFAASLHARVQTLAGLEASVLSETFARVSPTAGAAGLIQAFRRDGHPVFAVSGGFTQILSPLAEQLGLTGYAANHLQLTDDQLTGRVEGEVVDRAVKRRRMEQWAAEYDADVQNVVAVGDGANDLDMVTSAGVGVAFCAKPALAEQADLVIKHRHLGLIGYALGLSAKDTDEY